MFMLIEGPNEEYELEQLKRQREKLLEVKQGWNTELMILRLKDTAFRLNTIKSMTPLQAYNHTVATLIQYREKLGVSEVNVNQTKWTIWGR
jgi:hypothetical protein